MYPETFFLSLKQKMKKNWAFAFCSAFCIGLLIHLFRLTNHLLTWDSVYNFYDSQNKIELGRCFLTLSCSIGSYYDLQWITPYLRLSVRNLFSAKKDKYFFHMCIDCFFPHSGQHLCLYVYGGRLFSGTALCCSGCTCYNKIQKGIPGRHRISCLFLWLIPGLCFLYGHADSYLDDYAGYFWR